MNKQTIDGATYTRMLLGGAELLAEHAAEINALNVFPVADGDTGTNMQRTLEGGIAAVRDRELNGIGAQSEQFAKGVLLAARGNSGVILSQIFAGIHQGLASYECVNAFQLAQAYRLGIERSYAAVQNPTEGTVLTVFRESTEYAASRLTEDSTVEDFFRWHVEEAERSLEATKELLPALAEADVIDSGGAGYLCIAEGMYETLTGKEPTVRNRPLNRTEETVDIEKFTRDSKLEFGYCTEFLLRLTTEKCNPDTVQIAEVIGELERLGGTSIVAYKQEDIIKVHVHTFCPGEVLLYAQRFGEFLTVKVENMSLGHSSEPHLPKQSTDRSFSVLAVASGDGLCALFESLGADGIIAGGQTANPSTEEFLQAFRNCHTEHILVLPNNKNVILAARQAAELYREATVHVLETKNLMQGYGALSVITPGIRDVDALIQSAERAAAGVTACEVTRAVRDVTADGRQIRTGEYLAISAGTILTAAPDAEKAVEAALQALDAERFELITLFVGEHVGENARCTLTEELQRRYPECELTVYEGGQPIYDYMIALE